MKKTIYTAIFNNHDWLWEPTHVTPGWEYICFTDDPNLKSKVWKIKVVRNPLKNKIKQARKIKIMPHKYLPDRDLVIWVDANIQTITDLDKLVKQRHFAGFTIAKHPKQVCAYREAGICVNIKKGEPHLINKQVLRYAEDDFPTDYGNLPSSGLMIRNPKVKQVQEICEAWWEEVKKGSSRDQVAFPYALWKLNKGVNWMPYNVITNEFNYNGHKGRMSK